MSFAENLRNARREKRLSQEDLAQLLDVSRQSVSKWEQGAGYPEAEKLPLLSRALDVSLDSLMDVETGKIGKPDREAGTITISSPHEHTVVSCRNVISSPKFKGGKRSPKYALFACHDAAPSFFGPSSTFLGWYANEEDLEKEISEINAALHRGIPTYELKYSAKVDRKFFSVKISEDN